MLEIHKNFPRRIGSGRGHHAASRVGSRTAHVHTFDRAAVLGIARKGSVEQQLIEGQLTHENVAFSKSYLRFNFPRRSGFAVKNKVFEIGADLCLLHDKGKLLQVAHWGQAEQTLLEVDEEVVARTYLYFEPVFGEGQTFDKHD